MKILIIGLLALFTTVLWSTVGYAATAEITWTDPDKYRDIDPGDHNRKHFIENTFSNLEKHFTKLAEKLPKEQVLKINVTDLDLAGDTHAGGIKRIRIVKEIYFPRMNFSYQLVNADGSEIVADKVVLKNMSFMMSNTLRYRNESLGYEKSMLDDWFKNVFKEKIITK